MPSIPLANEKQTRSAWNASGEKRHLPSLNAIASHTWMADAGAWWRKFTEGVMKDEYEPMTNFNGLKMITADRKQRMTDDAEVEQLLTAGLQRSGRKKLKSNH